MALALTSVTSLETVSAESWDALAPVNNPFVRYGFLRGLEVSCCVGSAKVGWVPRHLLVHEDERLVAALPLYEKYDSYGEFIFDWSWSRAAQMNGIPYYPKLVSAVPFTPATGQRFLTHPDYPREELMGVLTSGLAEVAKQLDVSSIHVLFETREERESLERLGFQPRASFQFHWEREPTWGSFDDYLGSMRASSRKQVRRERRRARSHGLTLRALRGCELEAKHWDALWSFYERTLAFKGAIRYLNPAFFDFLRNEMTDHVFATFAEDDQGNPLAGSLFLTAGDQLFGRYWGAVGRFDCLHFELCYYLPIEWSLNNGIERFEAGAQGEHKLKRGFLPQECYSSHFIRHPGLANAIAEFLPREAEAVGHEIDYYQTHSPFKAPEPTDD